MFFHFQPLPGITRGTGDGIFDGFRVFREDSCFEGGEVLGANNSSGISSHPSASTLVN